MTACQKVGVLAACFAHLQVSWHYSRHTSVFSLPSPCTASAPHAILIMACAAASLNDEDISVDAGASPKALVSTTADALPDQMLYLVLQYLKTRELGGVACVSKAFNDVAKVGLVQQHVWQAPGTPITRLRCAQDTRLWRSLQFQDDQYNLTATQATRVISMASTRFSPAQLVRRCADACVCGVVVWHSLRELVSQDGIRSIDFTGCIRLDDSAIDAVRTRCPRLEEFRLGGTLGFRLKLVTARALVALVESCTLLSTLELRGVTQLSDEAVQVRHLWCMRHVVHSTHGAQR